MQWPIGPVNSFGIKLKVAENNRWFWCIMNENLSQISTLPESPHSYIATCIATHIHISHHTVIQLHA